MSRCCFVIGQDPDHCMTVISIQSQVAFGHVGNSAAVFPMQMHGIDVTAVPTHASEQPAGTRHPRPGARCATGRRSPARGRERGAVDTCENDPVRLSRLA